jgi:PAS domain S-box-containing protein
VAHTEAVLALNHTNLAGRPEMTALLQAPNREWRGAYENFEGVQVVGVAVPIEGTEWVVITEVAASEAFATSRTALLLLTTGLSLVGLLVIVVTGRFLNTLILRPLEQLEAGAVHIGQGDLSYRLDLGRRQYDEVSRVAIAFNDMASHLRDRDARIAKQTQILKEREERFRQVVSSVSDHIYMSEITQDGSYINRYIAPNIQALTGYPYEKFAADWRFWPSHVIHPDDQAAAAAQAARFAQGENSEMEYRLVRADGTIIWVRDSGQVGKNPDGQSVFVFGVVSDITERKQAEKAREQQQAFLQQVIDINPHFVFAKDRQGRFTLVNQAFARIYGLTVPEVIGKTDADLNSDKTLVARYQRDDQEVIASGQDLVIPEDMVINSQGQKVWRHTIKRPIINEAGQVSQVLGIAIDITQRKQIEEALRFQKALLEAQGEASLDGILVVSTERTFLYFNQRFVEMWGIPRQVMESRSSQAALEAVLNKVSDPAGFVARVNYLYEHRDEKSQEEVTLMDGRTLDRYSAPVQSPEGIYYGRVWYFRDITERKRVEEAIALARDRALEASRLKSELLARVSHELRTPLNAILGYTEILHEGFYGSLSNSQMEVAQKIILSATHLAKLVNEILDQAQLEANSVRLEEKEFKPAELIDRIERSMTILAQTKGLQLTTGINPNLPATLFGDPERIYQVLNNLVNNALKFTEQGSVKVRMYRPYPEYWAIEVADTGPGIPEEAKAYIFDAFRQVDGSITRKHGGSGLGLSIVKQLISLMGGEIMLESTEGQGSTFRVLLPLVQALEARSKNAGLAAF